MRNIAIAWSFRILRAWNSPRPRSLRESQARLASLRLWLDVPLPYGFRRWEGDGIIARVEDAVRPRTGSRASACLSSTSQGPTLDPLPERHQRRFPHRLQGSPPPPRVAASRASPSSVSPGRSGRKSGAKDSRRHSSSEAERDRRNSSGISRLSSDPWLGGKAVKKWGQRKGTGKDSKISKPFSRPGRRRTALFACNDTTGLRATELAGQARDRDPGLSRHTRRGQRGHTLRTRLPQPLEHHARLRGYRLPSRCRSRRRARRIA